MRASDHTCIRKKTRLTEDHACTMGRERDDMPEKPQELDPSSGPL